MLIPSRFVHVAPLALALGFGCSGGSSSDTTLSGGSAGAAAGSAEQADNTAGSGGSGALAGSGGGGGSSGSPEAIVLPTRIERYLRATSPRLIIEVDAVQGLEPYPGSLTYLGSWLSSLIDKPEGISFEADETLEPQGSDTEWTFEALDRFAREHARDDAEGPARIHVLSLDGRYVAEGSGTVLGLAWGNRYVALFQDALRGRCEAGLTGALQQDVCESAERNVWAHEFGHTLGLVDNGIPMVTDHRDPEHGRHDVREGCLMYWAYDGAELFDTLLGRLGSANQDLELCAESEADISAAR